MPASISRLAALALPAALLCAPALADGPATFTERCSVSGNGKSIWVGYTTDSYGNTTWYRAESAVLAKGIRTALEYTDSSDICEINPQTSDAGLNPQTSDAGLVADRYNDLVVLQLSDYGEPLGMIAVYSSGRIDVDMSSANANKANRLLISLERLEQAAVIHHLVGSGTLKTALGTIF